MREYLLRRLLLLIPTLLGVTFIVFLMMHFIPGDPVTNMMGETYSAEDAQKLRHELGLDQPMVVQYGKWLILLLRGDWGRSILSNRPVLADILYRLPVSIELLILSMLVSLIIAFPAGIIAAVWPNSWKDYSAMMVAMAGVSIPEFFLGVLLFLIFALTLRWFPVAGHINLLDNPAENLRHMLLPTIALGLPRAALLTRLIRASLLEVLRLEYVTTARAKGLSDWVVILRHALKNALIPTVTVIGLQVGFLIGAAIVVETLFAMPGIGSFGVDAKINLLDATAVVDRVLVKHDFEMVVSNWANLVDINMRSVSFFKGQQSDYMGIDDPKLEELVHQWRRALEPDKRKAISADIQRLIAEQLYWVNDTGYPFYQARTSKVKGYPFYNQAYLFLESTWLDK